MAKQQRNGADKKVSGNLGFEDTLFAQSEEFARLEKAIRNNLEGLIMTGDMYRKGRIPIHVSGDVYRSGLTILKFQPMELMKALPNILNKLPQSKGFNFYSFYVIFRIKESNTLFLVIS